MTVAEILVGIAIAALVGTIGGFFMFKINMASESLADMAARSPRISAALEESRRFQAFKDAEAEWLHDVLLPELAHMPKDTIERIIARAALQDKHKDHAYTVMLQDWIKDGRFHE